MAMREDEVLSLLGPNDEDESLPAAGTQAVLEERAWQDPGEVQPDNSGASARKANEAQGVRPLTEEELRIIISQEIEQASGYYAGELAQQRIEAMRDYLGEPRGDEIPGRSKVISMDLQDAVHWVMPEVMEALYTGGIPVAFDPTGEDDEEQAELETECVDHVIRQRNDGFTLIYSFAKDAAMQRNGIIKAWQNESTKVGQETYEGLTDEELAQLLNPTDGSQVEPIEYEPTEPQMVVDPLTGGTQVVQLHNLKLRRTTTTGKVTCEPVPPEEFLVNRDHNSICLEYARFTAHKRIRTESDLISEGWPIEKVKELPTYTVDDTGERTERRELEDERDWGHDSHDPANRRVQVFECYAHVDMDGDGIAELLQVHVAGQQTHQVMGWEAVDENPFVGSSLILLTHKFYGLSFHNMLKQVQDQKTATLRSLQDNLYFQNNVRHAVVAGQVNLDDMLTSRPGGIVRQKQPGMIEPLVVPPIGEAGYQMLEHLDNIRTGRVGLSPDSAEVAKAIAGDTAHGLERLMSMKEKLVGLMVQTLAHTGMKPLAIKVRNLLMKHQRQEIRFKAGGKWKDANPTAWKPRESTSVEMALGSGDRLKRMMVMDQVLAKQEKAIAGGGMGILVTPKHVYRALCDWGRSTQMAGDMSDYWQDPESPEAQRALQMQQQQAQQQEQMAAQQQHMMLSFQKMIEDGKRATEAMKAQLEHQESMRELMFKYEELAQDVATKLTDMELKYGTDVPGSKV